MGRVEDRSGSYNNPAQHISGSGRNQRTTPRTRIIFICHIGALRVATSAPEVIGTRKSPSPNLLV